MSNKPHALSGEEAKAIVIAKYPSAVAKLAWSLWTISQTDVGGFYLGNAASESGAWIDAAKNMETT